AKEIDDEVRSIISTQYDRAKAIVEAHRPELDAIAAALLERETLGREEIEAIMSGNDLPPAVTVSVPTYAEKRRESEEKRKGAIFQPRPREVPSAG
ncbi:MAG: cell division protein FtsH, partial [Polyangiales bacterium]